MMEESAILTGGVELLDRSIAYTLGSLQAITPAALARPTPCGTWTLRELLAHMDDSLAALCEAADMGRVELEAGEASGIPAVDTITRLRQRACRLLSWSAEALSHETISVADHHLTAEVVTTTGALEITVHGWDVAQACGLDRPVPDELAAQLFRVAPRVVTDRDRPGRFAQPVALPAASGPSDRLMAFLGRRPGMWAAAN